LCEGLDIYFRKSAGVLPVELKRQHDGAGWALDKKDGIRIGGAVQ